MKKLFLVLLFCFVAAPAALQAQDLMAMEIRFGKEKALRRVVIELNGAEAPLTVENFKKLARKKFYKGIAFHRALPGYLVQAGDPQSRGKDRSRVGTGGPGYTIPAEIRLKHLTGSVAMASLPDKINPAKVSNGSQFYVTLKAAPQLDGTDTVFGRVIEGLDVLQEISNKATDTNDYPRERIVIRSVKPVAATPAN